MVNEHVNTAAKLISGLILLAVFFGLIIAIDAYHTAANKKLTLPSSKSVFKTIRLIKSSGFTLFANNFYALEIQHFFYNPVAVVALIIGILISNVIASLMFIFLFWIFALLQAISLIYEKARSSKMGLKFFVIRKGPPFILTPMLEKYGAPVGESYTEIHVNSGKKYPDMDTYCKAMQYDAELLRCLADKGKLTGILTINSFNRQAAATLEKAFTGYSIYRKNAVCLTEANLTGWKGKRFQKRQKKMFGKVLSHRDVGNPEEWDLLVISQT